jgi:glycosyltransferase involved in cell wall biosynthesis
VLRGRPYPIAFLLTSFDVGGTERQMVELIHRLDRSLFTVHVACFHRRGALEPRAIERAASVATFPVAEFHRPAAVRQWLAFAQWCRRLGARIVHTCNLYCNVFGLPAAAFARIDVRVGNRRELVTGDKTPAQLRWQRLAYATAQAVVANSTAAAEQLRREGVAAHRIRMIPNGVDLGAYQPVPERGRIRRIVTVANLRPEKGHDTLLAAAPAIVERHPDVEFCFVGDGPLRTTLARDVEARGLAARVTFMGQRTDVPALLASSDLFVLPSRSEACPNGVLEAMAAGLPVVAARVGGVPELIESGTSGVLVNPNDPTALSRALLSVMDRPSYAHSLGRAARRQVERRFSFDRMIAGFEQLYCSELEKRAVARAPRRELAAS